MKKLIAGIRKNPTLYLFMLLVAVHTLGNGFSDSIYANYYKEVYAVSAQQRAFIELPREFPGILCSVLVAALSMIGDFRISLVAQVLACAGLTALGVFTPSFGVMLVFLFFNSLGMHLFLPLIDSIGMSLAEPGRVGQRVGQVASVKTAFLFISGLAVFFLFRFKVFSFNGEGGSQPVFLLGAAFFCIAIILAAVLAVKTRDLIPAEKKPFRILFRKEYKNYYILTVLTGVQKQIAYVYGGWVIIDLLGKGADVTSLLIICASFIGILFYRQLGRWLDRFGIRAMMYVDALSFIMIYVLYGLVVWAVAQHLIGGDSWKVILVYAMFVLDRMSMQTSLVKSVYLRSIALTPEDVTPSLSTGLSLDHVVAVIAAQVCGWIWTAFGPQYVFFFAALCSLGNLYVATRMKKPEKTV